MPGAFLVAETVRSALADDVGVVALEIKDIFCAE